MQADLPSGTPLPSSSWVPGPCQALWLHTKPLQGCTHLGGQSNPEVVTQHQEPPIELGKHQGRWYRALWVRKGWDRAPLGLGREVVLPPFLKCPQGQRGQGGGPERGMSRSDWLPLGSAPGLGSERHGPGPC